MRKHKRNIYKTLKKNLILTENPNKTQKIKPRQYSMDEILIFWFKKFKVYNYWRSKTRNTRNKKANRLIKTRKWTNKKYTII